MTENINSLNFMYYSMAKYLFEIMEVDITATPEISHQMILIFSFGIIYSDGKKKELNEAEVYEIIISLQKKVMNEDNDGAKLLVDFVFDEIKDENLTLGTYGMLFKEGEKSQNNWSENNLKALSISLNDAVSSAEFEMFGCRKISKYKDSYFNSLKLPNMDQLPSPNSKIQHYNNFSKRFNPVPYYKSLWGNNYGNNITEIWSLNINYFKEGQHSTSSLEELLLCVEHSCSAGPYISNDSNSLAFFRWIIEEIRFSLVKKRHP